MGRISETNEVFLESFRLCKKNKATFITPIITLIFSFIPYFLGIWLYIVYFQSPLGVIALFLLILLLTMYLRAFFSSLQTWIIAHTVWEEKASLKEGIKRTLSHSGNVLFYSIIALIVGLISQSLKMHKKNVLASSIRNYFEGISEDMWENVANLTLPGMVLSQKNFGESLNEVKKGISFIPEIKFGELRLEYFTYPMVVLGLVVGFIVSWQKYIYVELGVMFFLAFLLIIFIVQSYIKNVYYTVLYLWMGEQIQRKKSKKKFETRVPAILENNVRVDIE